MKNILITTLLFITCTTGVCAQSGTPVKTTWGLKAETNLTGFIISGTSEVSSSMKPGASLGGFADFEFTDHWLLQGNFMFHYKGSDMNIQGIDSKYNYWGAEISLYATYQFKFQSRGRIYVGIGPYSNFGFDARLKKDGQKIDLYKNDGTSEVSAMKDFDTGFGVMLGYEFASGIQINAGYKIGVTNILDANSSAFKMIPHTVNLGIGYRFGK